MQTARSSFIAPSAARLSNASLAGYGLRALALSALGICLLATSCSLKPMAKHATAFSTVSTEVIENSEDAYRAAIDLHDREMVSAGVLKVEAGKAWDYDQLTPLMTPEALQARIRILEALKSYAQSLNEVTSGLASPTLTTAATTAGANLKTLGATLNTVPGAAQSGFSISAQTANMVSSATLALGEYLVSRKVNAALPGITAEMDPQVEQLCKLLNDDIEILRRQSKKDYEDLSRQEWTFIQVNKEKMSPVELRDEIEKLPTYRKNEQRADGLLAGLHACLGRLALTHHALAAAAQGNNAETITARLGEVLAAGNDLKTYYKSLPAQ